jgi:hypothetical protein
VRAEPLANRVDPFGALFATPERGGMLGNRGGRFHDPESRAVPGRPFASRQWICCLLSFKDRRREVWSGGYTELFFCDEVSALAAGHRPCFECRREDAKAFAAAWARASGGAPPRAAGMDRILHDERITPHRPWRKRIHSASAGSLVDGVVIAIGGQAHAVDSGGLRQWRFAGWGPRQDGLPAGEVALLTPPSIAACLAAGYRPAFRLAP